MAEGDTIHRMPPEKSAGSGSGNSRITANGGQVYATTNKMTHTRHGTPVSTDGTRCFWNEVNNLFVKQGSEIVLAGTTG
jgi:hypothetical protein